MTRAEYAYCISAEAFDDCLSAMEEDTRTPYTLNIQLLPRYHPLPSSVWAHGWPIGLGAAQKTERSCGSGGRCELRAVGWPSEPGRAAQSWLPEPRRAAQSGALSSWGCEGRGAPLLVPVSPSVFCGRYELAVLEEAGQAQLKTLRTDASQASWHWMQVTNSLAVECVHLPLRQCI